MPSKRPPRSSPTGETALVRSEEVTLRALDGPSKQDLPAAEFGVVLTSSGNVNLQIFLGDASELDDNGGGGFFSYTLPVSGVTYEPSRTI